MLPIYCQSNGKIQKVNIIRRREGHKDAEGRWEEEKDRKAKKDKQEVKQKKEWKIGRGDLTAGRLCRVSQSQPPRWSGSTSC